MLFSYLCIVQHDFCLQSLIYNKFTSDYEYATDFETMNNEIEFSQKDTENNNDHLNAQIVSVGVTTENVYKVKI